MEQEKSLRYYVRALHRDIGFLVIGLTLIYALSGIVLTFRESPFLKEKKLIEKQLKPEMDMQSLERTLHVKNFKVIGTEGDMLIFNDGIYNRTTGKANYMADTYPVFIEKLNALHRTSGKSVTHIFTVTYAVLLIFLALSSLLMYRKGTGPFRRGISITALGLAGSLVILLI